ncbi:MAG: hypothetical protein JRI25_02010 [Deltaproteobacteria bacterium]|nr:hypothetical protein [Deltaproteobacteria bacterium]MBW2253356.1 hypothetical protein [Deltaproteobacteria bacterium]
MSPMFRPLLLLAPAALALVVGCAGTTADREQDDTGNGDDTGIVDLDDSGWDTDAPGMDSPLWFKLDGTLVISEGEATAAESTLLVQFLADPDVTDTGSTSALLSCTNTPAIQSLTAAIPSDATLPILGWWIVVLDQAEVAACPWDLPQNLHIGIGGLDAQLYPAMDVNGFNTDASTLYGLYIQYGAVDAPIWVFGVAGTLENYQGTDDPAAAAPLPDGSYDIETLHLLPWNPASR